MTSDSDSTFSARGNRTRARRASPETIRAPAALAELPSVGPSILHCAANGHCSRPRPLPKVCVRPRQPASRMTPEPT
ncbi:MAG: hypothetical protein U0800_22040 [Isosphaeraceae bacterium]